MKIRNVLVSFLLVLGVGVTCIGCHSHKKDRYIWSPRVIIISPEDAKSNDLVITTGRVLTSRSGFSWYDYQTVKKAGIPYCWANKQRKYSWCD